MESPVQTESFCVRVWNSSSLEPWGALNCRLADEAGGCTRWFVGGPGGT
jgi:hypothetical protein